MRIGTVITGLDEYQWDFAQRNIKTSYDFADNATRVCVTLSRGAEEKHAEMPVSHYAALLMGLSVAGTIGSMKTVLAILAPDDERLPEEKVAPMDPGGLVGDGIK